MTETEVDQDGHFVNTLLETGRLGRESGGAEALVVEMREYADVWMDILVEQLEVQRCCSGRQSAGLNSSVLSGTAGLALLDLFLARSFQMSEADRQALRTRAYSNVACSLKSLRRNRMSFLGGDSGPLAIAIVLHAQELQRGCGCEVTLANLLNKLLGFQKPVTDPCMAMPSEILFGRGGYLWALLYVHNHFPKLIPPQVITQVVVSIVRAGLPAKRGRRKHLMYAWKDKQLLGAAHGLHGILYVLLKAKPFWPAAGEGEEAGSEEEEECSGREGGGARDVETWVRHTLDFMLDSVFASGNTLAATGHSVDKLVNWAHGASGAIFTFIEAHKEFKDPDFLHAATQCARVIWTRGLTKSGYGLAEGVAGNAYALMALYTHTKEKKWRECALLLASFCFNYGATDDPCPTPCHPLGLYEGLPGVIYMLYDFTTVCPKMPAYEL